MCKSIFIIIHVHIRKKSCGLTHLSSLTIQQFNTFQLFQLFNSYLESVIHFHLQKTIIKNNYQFLFCFTTQLLGCNNPLTNRAGALYCGILAGSL